MYSRKFPTFEDAITYLEKHGTLEYFGRAGENYEYCVYSFFHFDGRKFHLSVYDNGLVRVRE